MSAGHQSRKRKKKSAMPLLYRNMAQVVSIRDHIFIVYIAVQRFRD